MFVVDLVCFCAVFADDVLCAFCSVFADDGFCKVGSVFADDVFCPVYLCGSSRPGQNQLTVQYSWSRKKEKMLFSKVGAMSLSMVDLSRMLEILRIFNCLMSLVNDKKKELWRIV